MTNSIAFIKRLNRKRIYITRKVKNYFYITYYKFLSKNKKSYPLEELSKCTTIAILLPNKGIGDLIVTSGLISQLRKKNYKVYCLINQNLQFLFEELIAADGVEILDKKYNYRQIVNKNLYFDIIMDPADPDKNLYQRIGYITAIKHKYAIGFNQNLASSFFDINEIRNEINTHYSDRLISFAKALNININNFKYDLYFSNNRVNKINSFIRYKLNNQKFIVFNPIASDKNRSLSLKTIRETLLFLQEKTNKVIITYNVNDSNLIKDFPKIIFNPFCSLIDCIALLKHASLVISTDTCFVHAANFFNSKLICIYNNRLDCNKYCNNDYWGPNYKNAIQIFSNENLRTETGDNLQKLSVDVIKKAFDQYKIIEEERF